MVINCVEHAVVEIKRIVKKNRVSLFMSSTSHLLLVLISVAKNEVCP